MDRENDKAKSLLKQLTLEEKIGMIHGAELFATKGVERLGIPPLKMSDGPMGVRKEYEPDSWKALDLSDDYVTYLPCNSAIAATWNRELAYTIGKVLGEETRGRGKDIILAPGVNIKRSPLCGRNFEYYSEDPLLTAEMAAAEIKGIQECDVAACVKHFAANSQETERLWMESVMDDEVMERIYLPAFYAAVKKAGVYAVMGAYNRWKGVHCCQNRELLTHVLREEWGFDGVVISDWGGVHDTELAAQSGLDIEMSVTDNFDSYYMANPLKEAVERGEIPEELIDEKVLRILKLMERLHMFSDDRKQGCYNTPQHRQKALEAAQESVVLLKNEDKLLPLKPGKITSLLVVGDNGERLHASGGGSAEIKALYEISPLMGIKMFLGGNVRVGYARGYLVDEETQQEENWQETSLENGGGSMGADQSSDADRKARMELRRREAREEALRMALEYDQVIFVGGLNHQEDSEGHDRDCLTLPYGQDLLIQELLKIRPDTVVVLMGGNPMEMGEWKDSAKGIVYTSYAGCEGGYALASVLFGAVNPSGKLPQTFPKKLSQSPDQALGEFGLKDQVHYREGLLVGYRYYDRKELEPEFCFGHGLSYTSFAYDNLTLKPLKEGKQSLIEVSFRLSNTGDRDGAEVAQLYLGGPNRQESEPVRELIDFKKVFLKAGESAVVTFEVPCSEEKAGVNLVYLGSSSRDIRLEAEL